MRRQTGHIVRMPSERREMEEPGVEMDLAPKAPPAIAGPEDFPYPKGLFLQRLFFMVVLLALVIVLVSPTFLDLNLFGTSLIVFLLALYILISSVSPLLASHTLTPTHLILRQGWYFDTAIPIDEIESVEQTEEQVRVGVKFGITTGKLYVTASRFDLVSIKLKKPRRFLMVLGKLAKEIVIDVVNPSRFVERVTDLIIQEEEPTPASPDRWFSPRSSE